VSQTPPYRRIADDIAARIENGALKPGQRAPSTRQIARDWRVAIATATKALAVLREAGLVRGVPGQGTIVETRRTLPRSSLALGRDPRGEAIAEAAIEIADRDGLPALSMRRLAAELGLPTMTLHGKVGGREGLWTLMTDRVFAWPLPVPSGAWRADLEALARLQWDLYQAHPWLAQTMSFTRPIMAPNAMLHTERALQVLAGLGLGDAARLHTAIGVAAHVHGLAASLAPEAAARQDTGMTNDEWFEQRDDALGAILTPDRYPQFSALAAGPDIPLGLDIFFEFGLQRLLDGVGLMVAAAGVAAIAAC
jgi:DNA-binding transcriptional regulator YhcF (GntR family)